MVQVKVAPVMSVLLHLKLRADALVVGGFLFKLCPVYWHSCRKQPQRADKMFISDSAIRI